MMKMTTNTTKSDAELHALGLSADEYAFFTHMYGPDIYIVRASEPCQLRAHRLTNPDEMALDALLADDGSVTLDSSTNRLSAGNLLEGVILNNMRDQLGLEITDTQFTTYYYHDDWKTVMTGHVDAMIHAEGDKMVVGEAKSTSEEVFSEVVAAIDIGDLKSDMLEKYRKQMRRYAAMTFLLKEPYDYSQRFNPIFGYLGVMNRNTCEVATRRVELFDEDVNIEKFIQLEIEDAFGYVHPFDSIVDRPKYFYRSHPICITCTFKGLCYNEDETEVEKDAQAATWAIDYADADLYEKLGSRMKKRVRASVIERMAKENLNKIALSDKVSVSRYSQMSRSGKVDYDAMRKDGVYDKYVSPTKEYEVVRFNVKR